MIVTCKVARFRELCLLEWPAFVFEWTSCESGDRTHL